MKYAWPQHPTSPQVCLIYNFHTMSSPCAWKHLQAKIEHKFKHLRKCICSFQSTYMILHPMFFYFQSHILEVLESHAKGSRIMFQRFHHLFHTKLQNMALYKCRMFWWAWDQKITFACCNHYNKCTLKIHWRMFWIHYWNIKFW